MNNLISKLIRTHRSVALLPLRLGAGTILAAHGAQKLFGWFGGYGLAGTGGFFESQLGMSPGVFWAFNAGAAEFFGGLMLLAGALTRVGADGAKSTVSRIGAGPNGAAIGPDGRCWVCNNGGFRYVERDGITQPAPAPRFSRTAATLGLPPSKVGGDTREALAAWGIDDVDALIEKGVAVQG